MLSDFIRVWGCNIGKDRCPLPCDTPYASDNTTKNYKEMSVSEVVKELEELNSNSSNVVITGGEPMLYKEEVKELIDVLDKIYLSVEIETNGVVGLDGRGDYYLINNKKVFWNISPKKGFINLSSLKSFVRYVDWNNLRFKFVVEDEKEVEEYLEVIEKLQIPYFLVWLMPKGVDREMLREEMLRLVEVCKKYGFNLSPRLHIELWGNVRGK
jgi:7-carboxy-7-deazaguanine synthase